MRVFLRNIWCFFFALNHCTSKPAFLIFFESSATILSFYTYDLLKMMKTCKHKNDKTTPHLWSLYLTCSACEGKKKHKYEQECSQFVFSCERSSVNFAFFFFFATWMIPTDFEWAQLSNFSTVGRGWFFLWQMVTYFTGKINCLVTKSMPFHCFTVQLCTKLCLTLFADM